MLLGDFNAACDTNVSTPLTAVCVCGSVVAVSCHVVRLLCPLSLCLPSGVAAVGAKMSATFGKGRLQYFTICRTLLLSGLSKSNKDRKPINSKETKKNI